MFISAKQCPPFKGLLVGQLSVVLLIGAFIKFFIFGEAPPPASRGLSNRTITHRRSYSINNGILPSGDISSSSAVPRSLREKPSSSNILRPVPSSSTNTRSILKKTYYSAMPTNPSSAKPGRHRTHHHHSSHQPESLDWFNVLVAQTIAQYRQTAYILKDSPTSSLLDSLTATLNNPEKKPSFIDKITVTDISLGEEFPIFSNCRVIAVEDPNSDGGRLQALMDVDLSDDNLSLAIETNLLLNYPKPFSAVLPVALAVSVVRFSGTLCISFVPGPTASATDDASSPSSSPPSPSLKDPNNPHHPTTGISKTSLAFSFLPDYRLDLSVRSLIGSRSRLQDVPKVAQLVEARVQAWFEERVVEPRVQVVGLPGLWPRMGRTGVRGGQDEGTESGVSAAAGPVPADIPGLAGTSGTGVGEIRSLNAEASRDVDVDVDDGGLRYRKPTAAAGSSSDVPSTTPGGSTSLFTERQNRGGSGDDAGLRMPGSLPDSPAVS
ncbi:hypothetical protein AJ80_08720 [Polytolypa hystricis UAMH7299]|uniref:Maintenance of mitochondrial morphology protein 1 n=1 Tax=Polytolypa hystricis (strain UAMH7299) TaxID=1447883 RepID=A0A2B7WV34_POLH7|nr:hypothetical protein AJ80_08720 [Polytolypa hystricis UAMH7299]